MRSEDAGNETVDQPVGVQANGSLRPDDVGNSKVNVSLPQTNHITTDSDTIQHDGRQQTDAFNDDMEDRPISPIQAQTGRPMLALSPSARAMLSSEDMPISPIVRDFSNHNTRLSDIKRESVNSVVSPPTTPRSILRGSENYKPRPHTIAVSDSVADQLVHPTSSDNQIQPASPQPLSPLQPPGRLSLALEKQNSATVTETEIHPALVHRTSSYGGSVNNAGRAEPKHRGNSVGPKPPPNIARLPPSVQKRYASYNSTDIDPISTPTRRTINQHATQGFASSGSALPTNISTDAPLSNGTNNTSQQPRKRSKSPFTRWRERSRSRDARQHARNDELLSQHYDEQRPAMPSYPPSRASVAASAGFARRDASMPDLADLVDPPTPAVVSPLSTKTKSSPFARFRERSRGRSFGRASIPATTETLGAQNGTTPTRPGLATRTTSGANGDRSLEQTVTADSDRRGRSRSFARFRTKSSTNTSDPADATTINGDRSRSKRRSWYNQFLCYDEHGIPVDAPLPSRPQSQGARSRSRTDVMRHSSYNVSSTNGLDMPQEPVPRLSDAEYADQVGQSEDLAQNQLRDRSRSVSRKRLASMTEAEREARVRSLRDRAMFAQRPQENGINFDTTEEVKRSSRVFGPEPPSRASSVGSLDSARRKFGPEPPPNHPPPLPPTPKQYQQSPAGDQSQPQSRPWATPNHQRQNPSFLEHKERRRQQLMADQYSSSTDDRVGSVPPQMRTEDQLPVHVAEENFGRGQPELMSPPQSLAQQEMKLPVRDENAKENREQTQPNLVSPAPRPVSPDIKLAVRDEDADEQRDQPQSNVVSSASSQVLPHVDRPLRAPYNDEQEEERQRDVASNTVPREVNLPFSGAHHHEQQERKQLDISSQSRASLPGLPAHLQHLQLTLSPAPNPMSSSRSQASIPAVAQQVPPRSAVQVNNEGLQHAMHHQAVPDAATSSLPHPHVQVNNEGPRHAMHREPVPLPAEVPPRPDVQVNNLGPQDAMHREPVPLLAQQVLPRPAIQVNNLGPQLPMHRQPVLAPAQQAPPRPDIPVNNLGPQHPVHSQPVPLPAQAPPRPEIQVNNLGPQHPLHRQTPPTDPATASSTPPPQRKRAESIGTSVHVNVGQGYEHDGDQGIGADIPSLPAIHARSIYPQAHTAQLPTGRAPAQETDIMRWRDSVAGASTASAMPQSTSAVAPLSASTSDFQGQGGGGGGVVSPGRKVARESWPLPDMAPEVEGKGKGAFRMSGPLGQSGGRGEREGDGLRSMEDMHEDEDVVFSPTLAGPGWEWRPRMDEEGEE